MSSLNTPSLVWLDTLITPAWATDANGRLLFANRALLHHSGVNQASLEEHFATVLHPEDRERVLSSWRDFRQESTPGEHQVRLLNQDGHFRWFSVQLQPASLEDRAVWIAVAHDIHALKLGQEQASQAQEATSAFVQSETQLSAILEALPVGVVITDASGRVWRDNAVHREMWGQGPETLSWQTYGEWVAWWPNTEQRLRAGDWALSRALLRGERVQDELVEYQPFGSSERRFLLNNAAPIYDGQGQLVGGVIAEQDVTQRLAVEQTLHENAERVQLALAAGAILGTWFWDLTTDRFSVDEGFAVNFGLDPAGGRAGLSLEQVIATVHPDDRAGLIAAIGEVTARGGSYAHQYRVQRRDGQYYWIEANGRVDKAEDGTPLSFPGVLLDAEERRAILEALRASETQFRELADHISQLAWTADASGALTWYNRRWYDYTGTTFEEMQGWGWQKVHHPEHVERVTARFKQAVETGEPWEDTFPLRSKDGQYCWFLSYAQPIRDETGQILRWFGTNTDVTQQREAELQLQTLNTSLEARVAARTADLSAAIEELGAFAYTASHDLRAPVRHVSSFAGLLRKKIGDDPSLLRYLDQIEGAAERMEVLINALLGLARSGLAELNKTDVDLGVLVQAVYTDLTSEWAGRNVTWKIADLPLVRADADLLYQVFTNLLSNAVKYSRGREEAVVEVCAEETAGEVVIAVRDNGVGFDPSHATKLFGVFQRLHPQQEFEGTGVGLANVKRVIEKHGGRVWASAQPGDGATFFFSLPQG